MGRLIQLVMEKFPVIAPAIAIILTAVSVAGGADLVPTLLQNLLVWCVGAQGLWAASGHLFMADTVAKGIGWPTGSPFQREIGFANLGIGVAGIMCGYYTGEFWLATIVVYSIFLIGAAFGHIYAIRTSKNTAQFNAGPILYTDLLIPITLIVLYVLMHTG